MTIYHSHLQGACVNGYSDHRTVMALTVAGLIAEGKTMITDGESINKTYPHFIETMHSLGANVHDEIS
jgi:3-phosphoshikimate 1-carboxyvinyltransferase